MAREVDSSELVTGIEPIDVPDDALIESVIVIAKVSHSNGMSSLHRAGTAGMSHWESIGMVYDVLQGMTDTGDWED